MFDAVNPPPRKPRLVELAENDLAQAKDNLYRAKCAVGWCDPNQPYGQSGQTLNDIIAGYERWIIEAEATVKQAQEATR